MEEKAKILVVDDQPEHLQTIKNILAEENNYDLIVASNGELACSIAAKEIPDLIIMDWDMPMMNGLEATKCLCNKSETKDIPIVITTGVMISPNDMKAAFEAGATEFLRKPIENVELITRIRSMLKLSNQYKEIRQHKNDLEKQNIELKEKNEELDAFSHTVAHDLKNPLNNIIGYLGIIRNDIENITPERLNKYAQRMSKTVIDMSGIIDELMMFSNVRRVDEIELEQIDSMKIIKNILTQNEVVLKDRDSQIIVQDNLHSSTGYGAWVQEVWRNLISNAIKYGGEPLRIEIGSELRDKFVCYWIKDNGKGISESDHKIIFSKFTRVNNDVVEGHGLGLSIVSRIVKKLGGDVGVECPENEGAKFYFTLPV